MQSKIATNVRNEMKKKRRFCCLDVIIMCARDVKMSVAGSHLCPLSASPPQTSTVTDQKPAAGLKGPCQSLCMF